MRAFTSMGLLALAFVAGCVPKFPEAEDADGDGFTVLDGDCDDNDAEANPETEWHTDADGDGHGDPSPIVQCERPTDGILDATDCDDSADNVYPGAPEHCDGVDENCNQTLDDAPVDPETFYADDDGDGFGDAGSPVQACQQGGGQSDNDDDCDDGNSQVHPGATELCNQEDDDCDGVDDDGATGSNTFYRDADADGYGDDGDTVSACVAPNGYVDTGFDCDDGESTTHPDAAELCDGIDNDCDVDVDEDVTASLTFYADGDGDGYGIDSDTVLGCAPPVGYAADSGDCDDNDPDISPGAEEHCDNADENCNAIVDESPVDGLLFFADTDQDGYGDTRVPLAACRAPSGYIALGGDCDDSAPTIYPGADEICDGADDDCDGDIDVGAIDAFQVFADVDGDSYGDDASFTFECAVGANQSAFGGDCDDGDALTNPGIDEECTDTVDRNCDGAVGSTDGDGDGSVACDDCNDADVDVFPGAEELCNSVDDDCDGSVDVGATDATDWYVDSDLDGYGDDTTVITDCVGPLGSVDRGGDCDDTRGPVNPGASEVCDASDTDDDCDGAGDDLDPEGAIDAPTWYRDLDQDGYGQTINVQIACDPTGRVATLDGDCNDNAAAVNPGENEICGGADEDCDGAANDADLQGAVDADLWYADADADAFGAGTPIEACVQPLGRTLDGTDCDDASPDVNPGAAEVCDALDADEDCDGLSDDADPEGPADPSEWYADTDGDGFGAGLPTLACELSGAVATSSDCDDQDVDAYPGAPETCTDTADLNCDGSVGATDADADGYAACEECDDGDADINPGAAEVCDPANVDEDCDGAADEADGDVTGETTQYEDLDGDGYGATLSPVTTCEGAADTASNDLDCDDGDDAISPDADELCDALDVDEDCDGDADDLDSGTPLGLSTFYSDGDGDGFGDDGSAYQACDPGSDATAGGDCDDGDNGINPDAVEVCDGIDQDCVGGPDNGATDTFYRDADGDTYGDPTNSTQACTVPSGYVLTSTDCDDGFALVHPGATEQTGDNQDYDCDGTEICWTDADGDGHRTFVNQTVVSPTGRCDDFAGVASNVEPADDCSDADDQVFGDVIRVYDDVDGDGYGDALDAGADACSAGLGQSEDATDCDDQTATTNPGATETCDLADNDCDGTIDEGLTTTFYADVDDDGFGAGSAVELCAAAPGYAATSDDCDDADGNAYPGAVELCDQTQNDCDAVGWTVADEDGVVSLEDDLGAWSDVTGDFTGDYDVVDGSTVYVCAGTYDVKLVFTDGVSASILGTDVADVTLDGGGAHRLIDMSLGADDVEFRNLTFTNGAYNVGDGAVGFVISADSLLFDTVVMDDNHAFGWSGGLYVYDSVVDIVDSAILNNDSIEAGALSIVSSQFTITDSIIDGNTATSGTAAVVLSGATATLASTGCEWGTNLPADVAVQGVDDYEYAFDDFDCDNTGCVTR